jgi:pimeloyl-ACP methyl ester carboxylesterase
LCIHRLEEIVSEQTVAFDYAETGSGPSLLFLPGSFGTGTGWKAVTGHLGDGYRMVTTSLLGYGATPDIRPDGNATMAQQVSLIDRIIDRIGTSPHVVGHSYGGLSAIAHALTGRHRPATLLLVEANPLGLLRASGDLKHYGMFESMTRAYFADFARGDAEAARHRFLWRCGHIRLDASEGAQLHHCDHGGERSRLVLGNTVRAQQGDTAVDRRSDNGGSRRKQPSGDAQNCRASARFDSRGATCQY